MKALVYESMSMRQLLTNIFNWRIHLRLILSLVMIVLATQLIPQPALATGVRDLPNLKPGDSTWVIDQGQVLSVINKGKINQTLDDLAKSTNNEVRLVTIHRLDYGETPESFVNGLFERWFPTPEAQAHQTLVVLDNVTNGTAIRTGTDVKLTLPDEIAESVVSETIQVPLRKGNNYNQAFLDASDRLATVLAGRPDPGPPPEEEIALVESTYKTAEETDAASATYIVIGLLIAATVIPMVTYFWYQGQGGQG